MPHVKIAGGSKITLTHATELSSRGHHVRIFVRQTSWRNRFFASGTWKKTFRVPITYVRTWEEASRHKSDVAIADSWQVAEALIACHPPKKLFQLIQHDERLYHGDREAVESVYRSSKLRKIVVATWLKELFEREFNVSPACITNTIDRSAFFPSRDMRGNDSLSILLLVHTYPWKGTQEGIDIVTRLKTRYPKVRLIGFGVRTPDALPGLDEYHYNPSQADLRTLYASSDVFLCPSWDEGFGLPSLEAMACGSALVTYDNGGSRDFAFDGKTALVVPRKDRAALENALARLIADKELRESIQKGGVDFVRNLPTWGEQAERFEGAILN